MSKAVKITLTETVCHLIARAASFAQVKTSSLPSIPDMPLPGLPSFAPEIQLIDILAPVMVHKRKAAKQTHKPSQQRLFPEKPIIKRPNLHLDIISLLKRSDYPVKDVKSLPSGENRITLSDLFEDYTNKEQSYEYVLRR